MTRLNRPIMPPAATSQTRRRSGFPSRLPGFLQAQPRSGDDPRPMRTNERTSAELRDAALLRLGLQRGGLRRLPVNLALTDGVALGCVMRIVVTPSLALSAARQAVEDVLRAIDAACSRFRMDSEIAQINIAPEVEHKVSPLLALALGVALDAARRTDGAVDPTVGGAVRLLGYDRYFDLLPPAGQPIRLRPSRVPGWQSLRFDARRRLIWLPRGVEVDLGATAKALAADLAAEAALAAGSAGVLVSLGGDIAVRGQAAPCGWQIQVCEDS